MHRVCQIMSLAIKPFYKYEEFAEHLQPLKDNWKVIRDEGLAIMDKMATVQDDRSDGWSWLYAPLKLEDEDLESLPSLAEHSETCKRQAPKTVTLCKNIEGVEAYTFSMVKAGGHINPHRENNQFVTCMLGLQVEDESYIIADGERRDFKEGEFVIFDYRTLHEVYNKSPSDRLLLLVLLPI